MLNSFCVERNVVNIRIINHIYEENISIVISLRSLTCARKKVHLYTTIIYVCNEVGVYVSFKMHF